MASKRASMREGPLAELFRATEAAQRAASTGPKPDRARQPATPSRAAANRRGAALTRRPPAAAAEAEAPSEPAAARWLEPLPDKPARLERRATPPRTSR